MAHDCSPSGLPPFSSLVLGWALAVVAAFVAGASAARACDCGPGDFELVHVDSTSNQIALAWQPIPGAAGFVVERAEQCADIGSTSSTKHEIGPVNGYGDTGLPPDAPFRFHALPEELCVSGAAPGCTGLASGAMYSYRVTVAGTTQRSNCVSAQLRVGPPSDRASAGPAGDGSGDLWADIVIGQPDFGQNSFRKTDAGSYQWGSGILLDRHGSPNRMFVADANHNRVLGFSHLGLCGTDASECSTNADCRIGDECQLDAVPDLVLGQPGFVDESACNGDGTGQWHPYRKPASADSMCLIRPTQISVGETVAHTGLEIDALGNLYVADVFNNRVLVYEDPFATDARADAVIGQSDFAGVHCNRCNTGTGCSTAPAANTLCLDANVGASGLALDGDGNLWVADSGNFRVLRFPRLTGGELSSSADLVLGQASFSSRVEHSGEIDRGLDELKIPYDVSVDHGTGTVYVADAGTTANGAVSTPRSRILAYDPAVSGGLQSGMRATESYSPQGMCVGGSFPGQLCELDVDCGSGGDCQYDLDGPLMCTPRFIEFRALDGGDAGLLIQGPCPVSGGGTKPMTRLVNLETRDVLYETHDPQASGMDTDSADNLYVMSRWWDLVRYDLLGLLAGTASADLVFAGDHHAYAVSADSMLGGKGAAVFGEQLVVADNHRLLIWNGHDPTDLESLRMGVSEQARLPDDLYGEPDFETMTFLRWYAYPQVHGGRLWVQERRPNQGNRLLVFDPPLTNGASFSQEIVLSDTSGSGFDGYPVLGDPEGRKICARQADEIDFDVSADGAKVWVADRTQSRVFRIVDWDTRNPYVDVILGQDGVTCDPCNLDLCPSPGTLPDPIIFCNDGAQLSPRADTLCLAYDLALSGDADLYVADNGGENGSNMRLLRFDASMFEPENMPVGVALAGPPASHVYGTDGAFDVPGYLAGDPVLSPFRPAIHPSGAMVLGNNPYSTQRYPVVFLNPDTTSLPQFALGDFTSYPVGRYEIDAVGNLYLSDSNYSRLLVYKDPLRQFDRTPGPTAAPTPTPTPCTTEAYGFAVLSDAPVAYWRLGETSGSTAGNLLGPDGTYTGPHTLDVPGIPNETNGAVLLSGGFVDAGNDSSIDIVRPLTISAWVKPSALPDRNMRIVGKEMGTAANFGLSLSTGPVAQYYFAFGTNYAVASWDFPFQVGHWYHLVATHSNDGTVAMWINGVRQELQSLPQTPVKSDVPLGIGSTNGSGAIAPFPGVIDEVLLFDHVVPDHRIEAHYFLGACTVFTPTPTTTPTFTRTSTATYTPTATWTKTPSSTATSSATSTSTASATRTRTASPAGTWTEAPVQTMTTAPGQTPTPEAQTLAQARCIIGLNRWYSRIAATVERDRLFCAVMAIRGHGDRLGATGTPRGCLSDDPTGRVRRVRDRLQRVHDQLCVEEVPDFGYAGDSLAASAGVAAAHAAVGADLFGTADDLGLATTEDRPRMRCQLIVNRWVMRLSSTLWREYLSCKRRGVRGPGAFLRSGADLEVCIGTDPRGRVERIAEVLQSQIVRRCDEAQDPAAPFASFAGVCSTETDSAGFTECLVAAVEARVEQAIRAADGL